MSELESEKSTDVQEEEISTLELLACTFNVGSRTFSIPIEYVKEITEVFQIFPLPLTPSYLEGIVHLRGSAIPVINMGRIENTNHEQMESKHLIVIDVKKDTFGIAVSEMPDLSTEILGELINVQNIYEKYRITQC